MGLFAVFRDIGSIWALFGVSNQLMASVGLIIGATIVLKIADKRRYILTCLIPLAYLYVTVNYAGYWMVRHVYLNPEAAGYSVLNGVLSIIIFAVRLHHYRCGSKKWAQMWKDPSLRMEASIPG